MCIKCIEMKTNYAKEVKPLRDKYSAMITSLADEYEKKAAELAKEFADKEKELYDNILKAASPECEAIREFMESE